VWKRVCGVVAREVEEAREVDVNYDMLYRKRERERDDKRKDDFSFFKRFSIEWQKEEGSSSGRLVHIQQMCALAKPLWYPNALI
jgi:hypothetical protein